MSSATDRLLLARAAADNMAEAVAAIRADDGVIVYANPSWHTMFGYAPGELDGRHISVVNAPTDQTPQERAEEIIQALRRDGSWRGSVHTVRKDGSRFWCEATVSEVDHPQFGRVWIAVQREVANHAGDLSEMRATLTRYRIAFDHLPTPTVLISEDLRLADANDAFRALTGYGDADLLDRPLADISHPDDVARDQDFFARVFQRMPGCRSERRLITKDGDAVPVIVEAAAANDGAGGAPFGILTISPIAS
jgi:PAS domain S-box-containing protein